MRPDAGIGALYGSVAIGFALMAHGFQLVTQQLADAQILVDVASLGRRGQTLLKVVSESPSRVGSRASMTLGEHRRL